jgi:hypothetical protein
MELNLYFDVENGIIVTKAVGEVINENVKKTINEAFELSTKHNCTKLLFDISGCSETQPIAEGFHFMKDGLMNAGLTLNHKCAVFYNPEIYPEERAKFIENVVTNRANPKFKVFKQFNEAAEWLKSEDLQN